MYGGIREHGLVRHCHGRRANQVLGYTILGSSEIPPTLDSFQGGVLTLDLQGDSKPDGRSRMNVSAQIWKRWSNLKRYTPTKTPIGS